MHFKVRSSEAVGGAQVCARVMARALEDFAADVSSSDSDHDPEEAALLKWKRAIREEVEEVSSDHKLPFPQRKGVASLA